MSEIPEIELPLPRFGDVHVEKSLDGVLEVHLPHQCDDWVVGDAEDVKEFIGNLQQALQFLESQK